MRVEIKSKEEIDQQMKIKKEEPAIRIVMNADFFYATFKYMSKLVKENPDAQKYVLDDNRE